MDELIDKIKDLKEYEVKMLLTVVNNMTTLALLQRESEWLSNSHYVSDCNKDSCSNCYSGDTEFEHNYTTVNLIRNLFKQN